MSIDLESSAQDQDYLSLTSEQRKKRDNGETLRQAEFLLKELDRRRVRLTWFVVAEIAEWYPGLVPMIRSSGHEIGWHTWNHEMTLSPEALDRQLAGSKEFLTKWKPVSYQAPAITFFKEGYRALREHGFRYSLSTYGRTRRAFKMDGVVECPVSTYFLGAGEAPVSYPANMGYAVSRGGIPFGSSFCYALGYRFARWFIDRSLASGSFVNMFIHNWQLCPASEEARRAKWRFFRQNPAFLMYMPDVSRMFFRLMEEYRWGRADEVLANLREPDHASGS
jgi:hypothetical protein